MWIPQFGSAKLDLPTPVSRPWKVPSQRLRAVIPCTCPLILFIQEVGSWIMRAGNTEGGKYHCTIDLLFDWFGLVCFANKNKNYHLSYSWFQTSQTGGQQCSDTSPFSIPCMVPQFGSAELDLPTPVSHPWNVPTQWLRVAIPCTCPLILFIQEVGSWIMRETWGVVHSSRRRAGHR
jgi:hypothetical protein